MGPSRTMKGEARKGQGGTPHPHTQSGAFLPSSPHTSLGPWLGENLKIRQREGKGHHTDMGLLELVLISTPPPLLSALKWVHATLLDVGTERKLSNAYVRCKHPSESPVPVEVIHKLITEL